MSFWTSKSKKGGKISKKDERNLEGWDFFAKFAE